MNDNKLKAFATQLVELATHLQDDRAMPAMTRSMSFAVGEKFVGLSGSDTEKFQELCDNFYQASGWSDKYSEGFVSNLLCKVLGDLYISNNTSIGEAALSKHLSDYQAYRKSHFVLVPLFGIALHVPSLKIGRVTFIQPSNSVLAQRLGRWAVSQTGQFILETLSGSVLAEFEAIAEPIRAKEMAIEETRRALEVLRYGIPFIFEDEYKSLRLNVSIVGDKPDRDCMSFVMPSTNTDSMTFTMENKRPAIPLHITEDNVSKLQECGAMDVAALLEKPLGTLSDIERIILRGLHWFGNALCHGEAENELLSLTTCLETFLTPKDGNPIGTAIAEGIAILLADTLEDRKKLKKRVKDLYGKRSGVSHGGEKAVLESDLVVLRDIAKRLIYRVITLRSDVPTQKALLEMIEDTKLR
jgi:hypothetical protein